MWCVGKLTAEYRQRMYALLELYARPYDAQEPVVCVDEKSKQLLKETRVPVPARPGSVGKQDYEYERAGTCNLFMSVEPKGQRRHVQVTARRTKVDFVRFVGQLVEQLYAGAKKLHLVLDNLNTHFAPSFEEVLGPEAAVALLAGVEFHYTPKHASWLNMAELEIGIMEKQCTGRRMSAQPFVAEEVTAWEHRRNVEGRGINWTFTREKADETLGRHYVA